MSQAAIINAIFAAVVIVIVVAPLLWAILTQHRDQPDVVAPKASTARGSQRAGHQRAQQRRYRPLAGRA
jgi:ABC-type glycerol-3-phosphate transport system permease component